MRVVEAAREEVAFAGAVQREKLSVTLTRIRFVGTAIPCPAPAGIVSIVAIDQQIHLAREPRERGHHGAAVVVLDQELRNEDRVGEVREGVVEALACVHAAQRVEIGFGVFADQHPVTR